jgi:DNA (cytosine-5)-methyltransferase 1
MNSLELFSGAGGLAKGLELSGFNHVALVELNKHACATLRENFRPNTVFCSDVRDFDLDNLQNIDIVAGGPPCQPFSLGGKHQAEQDHRDMFPAAIRAIEKLKPKAFIFENVKGLLRQTFADYFEYIIHRLTYPGFSPQSNVAWREHLGELRQMSQLPYAGTTYDVHFQLINAADYGVPQTRERVFIIGIRSDLKAQWSFPLTTHSRDRLLWDMYVTEEYWERHQINSFQRPEIEPSLARKILKLKQNETSLPPRGLPWRTVRDVIGHLPDPQFLHHIEDHLFRDGARTYPGHTGSALDAPAKTIKAGDHGVPGGENMIRFGNGNVRYLTVFEAKLIQTFPPDFIIKGGWGEAMRQIGNAVPAQLAATIAHQLFKTINTASLNPMKLNSRLGHRQA